MPAENKQAIDIRETIKGFLTERFNAKAEKLSADDPKYTQLAAQFAYDDWITDAARRVGQLQVVTHSLKPTHPDAKGSSVYAPPGQSSSGSAIGTQSLGEQFTVDAVGNAAALDVFKFLKLTYDGRTLLEHVEQRDASLEKALSDDTDKARQLMEQFATITEPGEQYSSHTRGKQLYWLIGDDPTAHEDFHLLAPLYATSLAHRVFQTINQDRFSDEAKAARDARRKNQPYEHGYCDYPGLAVQRFGGSKPQNISQLNSERGGNSYLLGSAPPLWRSRSVAPIRSASAFRAFSARPAVRPAIRALAEFLAEDPAKNVHTRDYRDELTAALVDELIVFTSEMHQLAPGWTDDWHCQLSFEQQCWLDPYRARIDTDFAKRMLAADWWPTICEDFSRWVNARLEWQIKHTLGDPEHRHFSKAIATDANARQAFDFARKDWQAKLEKELAGLTEVFNDDAE